jgi:predicted nucleic acid-binding protein
MIYFDTSFLVPLIIQESTSNRIALFMRQLDPTQFTISQWVRVEFSSVVARDVRMGKLERKVALRADSEFESKIGESFDVLLPRTDDFELAKHYLMSFEIGLRPGDAFHLAIARNHRARAIYSLDKAMIKAGAHLGLPVMGLPGN